MHGEPDPNIAGVAALSDPVRRALYRCIVDSPDPVSREQAASAVGIQRTLAAFHLDKLAEEGLLDVEFRRLTGRSGPGAGRPAKLYRRSEREITVSLPPREYDLAGQLLAQAILASETSGRAVRAELDRASRACGQKLAEAAAVQIGRRPSKAQRRAALLGVLRAHGFEPRTLGRDIVLANCPFHHLAQQHPDLVCGMTLQLLQGLRGGLDPGEGDLLPRLEPQPGQCCVKLCGTS